MCEKHHLQTSHREGLPDWKVPAVPAGISSKHRVEIPTYFAWKHQNDNNKESMTLYAEPAMKGEEMNDVFPVKEAEHLPLTASSMDRKHTDHDTSEAKSKKLREKSQAFLIKLAENAVTSCSEEANDHVQCQATPTDKSKEVEKQKQEIVVEKEKMAMSPPEAVTTTKSIGISQLREDPERRQSCPCLQVDTSLQALVPVPPQRPTSAPSTGRRTTSIGSLKLRKESIHARSAPVSARARKPSVFAAGYASNYQPRRILSGADALDVAKRSAQEFLGANAQEGSRIMAAKPAQPPPQQVVESEKCVDFVIPSKNISLDLKRLNDPDSEKKVQKEIIPVVHRADSAVQTDIIAPVKKLHVGPTKPRIRRKHVVQYREPITTRCTVCKPSDNTAKKMKVPVQQNQVVAKLPNHESYSCNPILMNPRYPPEPMIFRAKSTYTIEYGQKSQNQR